jgi:tRNA modification GTPase
MPSGVAGNDRAARVRQSIRMITFDTITAVSSATGRSARMIVRVSGPAAIAAGRRLCPFLQIVPGTAARSELIFQDLSVPAWIYVFAGPRSYSGEDLVEFHVPGNPLVAQMLTQELLCLGARSAGPGEFTARAYFSGRIDLTEAEGVAATVSAQSESELRAARQLLSGELARRLRPVTDMLAETLALVEVGIDFSDEDVTFLAADEVERRIRSAEESLEQLTRETARFEQLTHEPQILLIGRPNAGKSTLLNVLAEHERAVVSPVAGTTRDALSADVQLDRGMVRLIDVAGLEPHGGDDEMARQMQSRALRAVETSDLVVLVHDSTDSQPIPGLPRTPDFLVLTKTDLAPSSAAVTSVAKVACTVSVSAVTGEGLNELREKLDTLAFGEASSRPRLALNARHLLAIEDAHKALDGAIEGLGAGAEVTALGLREAIESLGSILGQVTPDDLLGRIFSRFCIGK